MLAYTLPKRNRNSHDNTKLPSGLSFFFPFTFTDPHAHDGDTFTCNALGHHITIRLRSIDAPELPQPFALQSRDALQTLIATPHTTLTVYDIDKYKRLLADPLLPFSFRAQTLLVRQGLAWVYDRYAQNEHALKREQASAQAAQLNIWSDPSPTPPWIFRHSPDACSLPPQHQVFLTLTGACFHRVPCPALKYPITPTTKERAAAQGYSPCALCKP